MHFWIKRNVYRTLDLWFLGSFGAAMCKYYLVWIWQYCPLNTNSLSNEKWNSGQKLTNELKMKRTEEGEKNHTKRWPRYIWGTNSSHSFNLCSCTALVSLYKASRAFNQKLRFKWKAMRVQIKWKQHNNNKNQKQKLPRKNVREKKSENENDSKICFVLC